MAFDGVARVLEVGCCGTGAISRTLAGWPGVGDVLGVEPSPIPLAKARELSEAIGNLSFREGDGRRLPLASETFDAVVLHRVLSHVPGPERVLAEAFWVLRPGGRLAVFDGDYATITLASGDIDPLQTCADAFRPAYIADPWVMRRLLGLVAWCGFTSGRLRSHGYVQVDDPDYMLFSASASSCPIVPEAASASAPRSAMPGRSAPPRRGQRVLLTRRVRQRDRSQAQDSALSRAPVPRAITPERLRPMSRMSSRATRDARSLAGANQEPCASGTNRV